MPKNTGLGRGLDALFAENGTKSQGEKTALRIASIEPDKDQPRDIFEQHALSELADSIAQHGVLQPILVRPVGDGFYRIIAGERRWRAAKIAGLTEIPSIVLDIDERRAAEISLIENLQREDLSPVEEARAFRRLIDEFGLTQEELAARLGKSRPALTNAIRLLDLPEKALEMLNDKKIAPGHARALLGLTDRSKLLPLAEKIAAKGLSVRAAEDAVRAENRAAEEEKKKKKEKADSSVKIDYVKDLEERVSAKIGRRFRLLSHKGGKVCEISYSDDDDLQDFLEKLCGKRFFD